MKSVLTTIQGGGRVRRFLWKVIRSILEGGFPTTTFVKDSPNDTNQRILLNRLTPNPFLILLLLLIIFQSSSVKRTKSGIPIPLDATGRDMCLLFIKYGRCRFKNKCKKSHWMPPLPGKYAVSCKPRLLSWIMYKGYHFPLLQKYQISHQSYWCDTYLHTNIHQKGSVVGNHCELIS